MVRMIGKSVRASLFIILTGCGAWNALAQTTNYSIPAGSGTLTYTETVAINGTCPISQPPAPSQQITQYTFSGFAYNGQPLSGSVAYLSYPSQSSYCPTSGWTGPIPSVLSESGFYVFFTPSLSGAGSATTNALTLSANQNPSVYGSNVQFTATEQFPNASGTVTFSDGSTTLGSEAMGNRSSSYSTASLSVGSHSITAAYISNNGIPSTTSPALSFTVNKVTPGLSVSCSPSTATYGSVNVNCTPYLSGGSSPTGSLSWGYTGGGGCTPGTWVSGWGLSTSVGNWAGFSPTIITVCAQYSGDSNNNSVSASTTFTINKATPSGGITCSPNPVTYQNGATQTATCTASLSAVGQGTTPTGSASIYWSGNFWASPALSGGSASLTGFNGLGVGSYSITGTYSGDGNYNGISLSSTTETIGAASQTISFTAPSSPVTYGVSPIVLSASASSGLGVSFSWSSGPCSVSGNTLTFTGAGTCVVAANQAGNSNYNAAPQVTQSVVVNDAVTVSQVSSNTNPTTSGQSVTFSSLVNTGGVTPTGTVRFEDGGGSVGTGTVSTVSTTNLMPNSSNLGVAWGPNAGSFTPSGYADPFGGTTAGILTNTAANDSYISVVQGGLTASTTYTFSVWLKVPSGTLNTYLFIWDPSWAWGTNTNCAVTASWSRCILTTSSQADTSLRFVIGGGNTIENGVSLEMADVQVEASASAGPYIATGASPQAGEGGVATFSTSSLAAGAHSITAVYGGDSNDSGSTSSVLNQMVSSTAGGSLPTTGLGTVSYQKTTTPYICGQYSVAGTQYEFSNFTFTPTAGGAPVPLSGNPIYYMTASGAGCPPLGWQAPSPVIFQGPNLQVYVTESGSGNSPSISTSINTLTLAPPYSGTMVYGTSLTFTAKQWNPSATGSITFFSGTTSLATVALVNGTASYTLTTQLNASTTPYSISATYNSSNGYATVSSPATAETVTQAPQSITFTSPSSATYGSGPITLSATGGASGNPVTFSLSSGPGSLSGNQLTISGAGTITVIANQAGNTNYSAATATTQSITVSKAALTITVSNATKTYGSGNPNFGYQPSGFVNGDTSSVLSGTPSYSTPATPASAVGSYTISASTGTLSAANYSFSFVSGTLTVTQAVLTVTANNTSRPYAAANPTFTASYTGWFNGDTPSVLSGSPSLTTTAVSSSVVGTYPITAAIGSLSSVNYSFIFANGTLTITPATPVITWATPAAVPNGTYLTSTQLNATANTPGTFVYNPAALTAMTEGNQTLSTTFTPTDTTDYTTATGSVSLMVTLAPATGIITTIAGNNEFGYAGNGGIATSAALRWPQGVATDSAGNLYIADSSNNVVRKVAASTGIITLYAGTGTMGFSGDGGAATSAELNGPLGVAVDSQGNLYIADAFNCVIRKVTPGGTITTVAGQGTVVGSAGNGVAATSATLFYPFGVAVDSAGNFYIADTRNNLIRKVTVSTGIITTVAGTLTPTSLGDGGPAIGASLGSPASVAVDSSNNIYIADAGYYRIREVSASTGNITTVAGNGTLGYSGDGGPATAANLNYPESLTLDAAGNLYIADTNNNVIRKVDSYGIISTVGNGTAGYTGDGGPAILAELDRPAGIALDSAANIYISDTMNSVIRAVGGGPIAPSISWASPSDIVYGTALGSNQLNASSPVAGTYTYSPAAGTVLTAGQHTLSVTFTPTDTSDYQTATYSVALTVNPATPVITWANPAAISDTTALTTSQQLNATASTAGTFTYSPSAGTVLAPGTHLLIAKFTPGDTTDFNPVTAYASIDVNTGSRQDAGTVTLSVNTGSGYTTVASTNYSAGATTSSIAEGLAGGVMAGSPVTVNAVNDEVNIAANPSCIQAGNCQSTNYPYIIQTTAWDSTLFTNPSFAYPEIMGNLEGGSAGSSTQQTIYQYTVPSNGYDPDGNLVNYNDTVMGTWSFNYDSLNRLSAGTQTPVSGQGQSPQSLCWTYDSFGNRTAQTTSNQPFANAAGASSCQLASGASLIGNVVNAYSSYTNQVTSTNARGVTATPNYDADGNVTSDGVNEYLYDAEDRICAVASTPVNGMTVLTGYIYDAAGTRVSKGMIQTWSCDPTISGFTPTNDYVLAPGGEQLTEYAMSTTNGVSAMAWLHTNVFAAGHLIATYDDTEVYFYLDDQVGTRRVQTDYAGNIKQTCSSLPYGDGETCGSTPTEHLFTGKERDTESGNDYFGARYYSSSMGRWTSPDTDFNLKRILPNPQRWNRYAYVINSPLILVDPNGLTDIYVFLNYLHDPDSAKVIDYMNRHGLTPDWNKIQANAIAHGNTMKIYDGHNDLYEANTAHLQEALQSGGVTINIGHVATMNFNDGRGDVPSGILLGNLADEVGSKAMHLENSLWDMVSAKGGIVAAFGCRSSEIANVFPGASIFLGVQGGDGGLNEVDAILAGAAFGQAVGSQGNNPGTASALQALIDAANGPINTTGQDKEKKVVQVPAQ
jgi:RHS repeat-associated protein